MAEENTKKFLKLKTNCNKFLAKDTSMKLSMLWCCIKMFGYQES